MPFPTVVRAVYPAPGVTAPFCTGVPDPQEPSARPPAGTVTAFVLRLAVEAFFDVDTAENQVVVSMPLHSSMFTEFEVADALQCTVITSPITSAVVSLTLATFGAAAVVDVTSTCHVLLLLSVTLEIDLLVLLELRSVRKFPTVVLTASVIGNVVPLGCVTDATVWTNATAMELADCQRYLLAFSLPANEIPIGEMTIRDLLSCITQKLIYAHFAEVDQRKLVL